ncbi:MAG: 30S ribosomal protein S6 [Verrucomicrobiae bacterium]|nr:30S ribosomal protein S6 [Verrucomicrobiae bacterium]
MRKSYEGLFILNTAGREESSKDIIEKLEKEIQGFGGKSSKVERMDKRPFARIAHKVESGYYVNIVFDIEPAKLPALRAKLKLEDDVFRMLFLRSEKKSDQASAPAKN